jgi:DNA-binding CsgD family transcriptional regulator
MCVLILDQDLNLVAGSQAADHAISRHDALIFRDNRLVGISGVPESKFCKNVINGLSGPKIILLCPAENGVEGHRLILRITPLSCALTDRATSGSAWVSLEVTTLDAYYSAAVKRVADRFSLTKAETSVLKYLMMGLSSEEITEKMMIGRPTLRTHQQRLRNKTGQSTSTRTILAAINPETQVDERIILEEPFSEVPLERH